VGSDTIAKRNEKLRRYCARSLREFAEKNNCKSYSEIARLSGLSVSRVRCIMGESKSLTMYNLIQVVNVVNDDFDEILPEMNELARNLEEIAKIHIETGMTFVAMTRIIGYGTVNLEYLTAGYPGNIDTPHPVHVLTLLSTNQLLKNAMKKIRAESETVYAEKRAKALERQKQEEARKKRLFEEQPESIRAKARNEIGDRIPDDEVTFEMTERAKKYIKWFGARNVKQTSQRMLQGETRSLYSITVDIHDAEWIRLKVIFKPTGNVSMNRMVRI